MIKKILQDIDNLLQKIKILRKKKVLNQDKKNLNQEFQSNLMKKIKIMKSKWHLKVESLKQYQKIIAQVIIATYFCMNLKPI